MNPTGGIVQNTSAPVNSTGGILQTLQAHSTRLTEQEEQNLRDIKSCTRDNYDAGQRKSQPEVNISQPIHTNANSLAGANPSSPSKQR